MENRRTPLYDESLHRKLFATQALQKGRHMSVYIFRGSPSVIFTHPIGNHRAISLRVVRQTVAYAHLGEDIAGPGGALFDFAAQTRRQRAQRLGVLAVVCAPELAQ